MLILLLLYLNSRDLIFRIIFDSFFLGFVAIAFTKKGRKGACPSNFMWNGQSFRLVKKWVANSGSFLQILHLYPMLDKIAHLCQTFFNENVYTSSLLNVNFRYKMSSFWQNIYLFKGQQILEVNFLVLISSEKTKNPFLILPLL